MAASPDGTLISWIVRVPSAVGWDLYLANSDGTDPRRLLANALNCGWSTDGRYVLARWTPPQGAGGLAVVSADGADARIVVPADKGGIDPIRSAMPAGDNQGPERTVQLSRNDQ